MPRKKNFLALGGVISIVVGVLGAVPSFLVERYGIAVASTFLVVLGLILLALAFED